MAIIKLKQIIHIGLNALVFTAFMSLTKVNVTPRNNCRSSTISADLSQPTDVHFRYIYLTTPEQTAK